MASPVHQAGLPRPGAEPHTTSTVVMVRPARFGANQETRASNAFQSNPETGVDLGAIARREFDGVVAALRASGVDVLTLEDDPTPAKPDAIFPNNWFSTHADGRVVLYPMHAQNRRAERRRDLMPELAAAGFHCSELIDLSGHELAGRCLEGTGSLVLDRANRIAYACRSPRTHDAVLDEWARALGYRAVRFDAFDAHGQPVYHTNVVMSVGRDWAVVCLDAIGDPADRSVVAESLAAGGHEVLALSLEQMNEFAGNLLELAARDGRRLIALSARARRALGAELERRLARHGTLVVADIPTIERVGGGSLRCMIAEVFLPRG